MESRLERIRDISRFFTKKDNQWIFTGNKLEVFIPRIYEEKGLITIGEEVSTLGIIQLRIDDKYSANILFLGKLVIEFSEYRYVTENDFKYIVLSLIKNSIFIQNSIIVKNGDLLFHIFNMFLSFGKIPPFMKYEDIKYLFDHDNDHCGISLKINHAIFEMIYAHIYRDTKDPYMFYRLTSMIEDPIVVPLKQISHMPASTTSKIAGGYLSEGITSALVDDTIRNPSTIENLLRS